MFQIKATRGNVNLSVFDLAELTNKANQTAQEIAEHNLIVQIKFRELVIDYITNLNAILSDLGLEEFKNINKQFGEHHISFYRDGLNATYDIGNGCRYIRLRFNAPMEGEKLTYEFNGDITIYKAWQVIDRETIRKSEEYKLESIEQVFNVGADVIKVMIIDRDVDVENYVQKQELFNLINY